MSDYWDNLCLVQTLKNALENEGVFSPIALCLAYVCVQGLSFRLACAAFDDYAGFCPGTTRVFMLKNAEKAANQPFLWNEMFEKLRSELNEN